MSVRLISAVASTALCVAASVFAPSASAQHDLASNFRTRVDAELASIRSGETIEVPPAAGATLKKPLGLKVASYYGTSIEPIASALRALASSVERISAGKLTVTFVQAAAGSAQDISAALNNGTYDAALVSAAAFARSSPNFHIAAGGVPGGLLPSEYHRWNTQHGSALRGDAYDKIGLRGSACISLGFGGGALWRRELLTPDDLKGIRYRTSSALDGRVMEKLGVALKRGTLADAYQQFELGQWDGGSFGPTIVSVSPQLGLAKLVKRVVFVGFAAPTSISDLVISVKHDSRLGPAWDALAQSCAATLAETMNASRATEKAAYERLQANGQPKVIDSLVHVDALARALQTSAQEVLAELSHSDDKFTDALNNYMSFAGK